ncbi:DUF2764 family protein [bacterium]|nr:DUF2764 family protein [bacterium]
MADDTRYAYAVARVRGMETRLLDRQWIERLLSESAEGALKALADSAYQDAVADVDTPEAIEAGLEKAMSEMLTTIAAIAPDPELIDLFRERFDYSNLKSFLKASLLKVDSNGTGVVDGPGTIPAATLEAAVRDKDYTMLPGFLADAARDAEEAYRDQGELSIVDHTLDSSLWEHSLRTAEASSSEFLADYFRTEVDLINIKTFMRMKAMNSDQSDLARAFIPGGSLDLSFFRSALGETIDAFARSIEYGKYGVLTEALVESSPEKRYALELACDNVLIGFVDRAKMTAYGIEPLIAFILHRTIEMKLVRTAIVAKLDGVERSDVEERLRMIHV